MRQEKWNSSGWEIACGERKKNKKQECLGADKRVAGVGCEIRTKFNYATNFRRDRYEATVYQSQGGGYTVGKCLKIVCDFKNDWYFQKLSSKH